MACGLLCETRASIRHGECEWRRLLPGSSVACKWCAALVTRADWPTGSWRRRHPTRLRAVLPPSHLYYTSPPSPTMFSPAVGRVARSAQSLVPMQASCLLRTACIPTPPQALRPGHQRRLSSSKPAAPPSSGKKKAVVLEENAAAKSQSATRRASHRGKKLQTPSTAPVDHNIPKVPPTTHLTEAGI